MINQKLFLVACNAMHAYNILTIAAFFITVVKCATVIITAITPIISINAVATVTLKLIVTALAYNVIGGKNCGYNYTGIVYTTAIATTTCSCICTDIHPNIHESCTYIYIYMRICMSYRNRPY